MGVVSVFVAFLARRRQRYPGVLLIPLYYPGYPGNTCPQVPPGNRNPAVPSGQQCSGASVSVSITIKYLSFIIYTTLLYSTLLGMQPGMQPGTRLDIYP